jgi:uncharacterized membrane protein
MAEFLHVFMRWLHISSAAALVGGLLYGRVVLWPSIPPEKRNDLAARAADRFLPVAFAAIAAFLASGVYQILTAPGHSARYHALLGVKLLLAAHVFAVAIVLALNKARNPERVMTGAAISGFIVIAIADYLRWTY